MIGRGTYKPEVWLKMIDQVLSAGAGGRTVSDWAKVLQQVDHLDFQTHVVYFGAGYWRGRLDFVGNKVEHVALINPEVTLEGHTLVEQGVCIILRLPYVKELGTV